MLTQEATLAYRPTPIEELRRPHPEQKRIDAESAALLRATALDLFRRIPSAQAGPVGRPTEGRIA